MDTTVTLVLWLCAALSEFLLVQQELHCDRTGAVEGNTGEDGTLLTNLESKTQRRRKGWCKLFVEQDTIFSLSTQTLDLLARQLKHGTASACFYMVVQGYYINGRWGGWKL